MEERAGTLRQFVSWGLLATTGLLVTKTGEIWVDRQDVPNGGEEGLEGVEQM